jgi:hypothetical protein
MLFACSGDCMCLLCLRVCLQAVRSSQSVLTKDRNAIINDFAPDKKVSKEEGMQPLRYHIYLYI